MALSSIWKAMTAQIPDTVICKRKKFDLLGYEGEDDDEKLFDPSDYGFSPQALHTACWRGYFCGYKISGKLLYLDTLCINDGNDYYPSINGVEVSSEESGGPNYSNINLLIPYTGLMRIGADFHWEHYVHMGFQKPSAYGIVWDIEFSEGKIIDTKDISEKVKEIRGEYHDGYNKRELIDGIYDAFKRDMVLR